jgi:hypothetical protein
MRWDNLFDDLESQLEHELDAEEIDLRAEEERLRLARLTLRDRLMCAAEEDAGIPMRLIDGRAVTVRPVTFGKDWFAADLIAPGPFRSDTDQVVVPLAAIASVTLSASALPSSTAEPAGPRSRLVDRLGLAFVLRDFCRRRAAVSIATGDAELHGTIDRVGRDHVDLAMHEPGSNRRASNVTEVRIVPLATIVVLRVR